MAGKKKRTNKRSGPPPPPVRKKAPRPEHTGPTKREQQRALQQAQQRRDALRRKLVSGGMALAALLLVGGYVLVDRRGDASLRKALTAGGCTADEKADPTRPTGQNHVSSASFAVNPPSAGDHLASVASSGVYSGSAVPQEGQLVHSLEHGYVIAWHQPDLPAEQKEKLTAFEDAHDGDVIVAERADLPVPVAATAWGRRLLCPAVDSDALERFFDEYVDKGPEDQPRG